jgi:hypothetical protein
MKRTMCLSDKPPVTQQDNLNKAAASSGDDKSGLMKAAEEKPFSKALNEIRSARRANATAMAGKLNPMLLSLVRDLIGGV